MIKLKSLLKEDHDPKLVAKKGEALLKRFGRNLAIQYAKQAEATQDPDDDFWSDMLQWLHGSYGNKVSEAYAPELLRKTKNYSLVRNTAGREFVIMTKKAYNAVHPDQKSKTGEKPALLVNNPKTGGTELWSVEFIGEALVKEAGTVYQVGDRKSSSLRELAGWVTAYVQEYLQEKDMELVRDESGKALYETQIEVKFGRH